MEIIALVNQKGGCGKTTTALNLASALSMRKNSVLLIDLDPQAHATFALGIEPAVTITDIIERYIGTSKSNISDAMIKRGDGFYVIGSSIGLSAIDQALSGVKDRLTILSQIIDSIPGTFDYCIVDCPPNLGNLTLNALCASNYAIVPMGVCELSLRGVQNLEGIITILAQYNMKTPQLHYLITQLDNRLNFSHVFAAKAKEQFSKNLFTTMIRTNIHLREAAAGGQTIFEYKKDSRGALDYAALAQEIEKLSKNKQNIQVVFKGTSFNDVYLVGEFNNWQKEETFKLKKIDRNTWMIDLLLKKGTYRYKFVADDSWINDPANVYEEDDSFGGKNSILKVG